MIEVVSFVYVIGTHRNFTPFSSYSPSKFAYHFLCGKFGMALLYMGADFSNFSCVLAMVFVKHFCALVTLMHLQLLEFKECLPKSETSIYIVKSKPAQLTCMHPYILN